LGEGSWRSVGWIGPFSLVGELREGCEAREVDDDSGEGAEGVGDEEMGIAERSVDGWDVAEAEDFRSRSSLFFSVPSRYLPFVIVVYSSSTRPRAAQQPLQLLKDLHRRFYQRQPKLFRLECREMLSRSFVGD